tara:strand:- start:520 stop:1494 length:975 start_codon:yes stop_codon:yes gene_type:complete
MSNRKKILITGESGFIGSHFISFFTKKYPDYELHGLDNLTYASNRSYTKYLESYPNYQFHQLDICDREQINTLFKEYEFSDVIHLAAESHVDNSIHNPGLFVQTNIVGTLNLLDAFKEYSSGRFHHVSTDEVYGDLNMNDPLFHEDSPYKPSSPYSASKASSDHLVRAYHRTYDIDIVITNCSNNYGPHQHKEKFIPTIIYAILNQEMIPVYGNGLNVRDWLYVQDHVLALDLVFHKGVNGDTYNIGSNNELSNINLVHAICDIMQNKGFNNPRNLIAFVPDRLGHDQRYAIDANKLKKELNWNPGFEFDQALSITIDWYIDHL